VDLAWSISACTHTIRQPCRLQGRQACHGSVQCNITWPDRVVTMRGSGCVAQWYLSSRTICSSCWTPGSSASTSAPTTSTSSRCSSSCSSVPRVAAAPGPPPAAAKRSDSHARRTQDIAVVMAVPAGRDSGRDCLMGDHNTSGWCCCQHEPVALLEVNLLLDTGLHVRGTQWQVRPLPHASSRATVGQSLNPGLNRWLLS